MPNKLRNGKDIICILRRNFKVSNDSYLQSFIISLRQATREFYSTQRNCYKISLLLRPQTRGKITILMESGKISVKMRWRPRFERSKRIKSSRDCPRFYHG